MPNEAHAAAVGGTVHLGKLEVKKDDRNLQLARYLDDAVVLPEVPASVDWSKQVGSWPMYGNDKLGDCTCAAVGHMEEAWSANAGAPEVPTDKDVLDLYWATGNADTGRYCLAAYRDYLGDPIGVAHHEAGPGIQIGLGVAAERNSPGIRIDPIAANDFGVREC